jgi:hypothetical protein
MKYALCAVLLTAFAAVCYYGATIDSRQQAADLQACYHLAKFASAGRPGELSARMADCDAAVK